MVGTPSEARVVVECAGILVRPGGKTGSAADRGRKASEGPTWWAKRGTGEIDTAETKGGNERASDGRPVVLRRYKSATRPRGSRASRLADGRSQARRNGEESRVK